eukprot:2809776-Rhodomonas_salina.1
MAGRCEEAILPPRAADPKRVQHIQHSSQYDGAGPQKLKVTCLHKTFSSTDEPVQVDLVLAALLSTLFPPSRCVICARCQTIIARWCCCQALTAGSGCEIGILRQRTQHRVGTAYSRLPSQRQPPLPSLHPHLDLHTPTFQHLPQSVQPYFTQHTRLGHHPHASVRDISTSVCASIRLSTAPSLHTLHHLRQARLDQSGKTDSLALARTCVCRHCTTSCTPTSCSSGHMVRAVRRLGRWGRCRSISSDCATPLWSAPRCPDLRTRNRSRPRGAGWRRRNLGRAESVNLGRSESEH